MRQTRGHAKLEGDYANCSIKRAGDNNIELSFTNEMKLPLLLHLKSENRVLYNKCNNEQIFPFFSSLS